MRFDVFECFPVGVPAHIVVVLRKVGRLRGITSVGRWMVMRSLPLSGMSIPPTFPLATVRPVLLIVELEVTARIPPDIIIGLLDGRWEVLRGKPSGERWLAVPEAQGRRLDIRGRIEPLLNWTPAENDSRL